MDMGSKRVDEAIALIKAGRRSEAGAILDAELRADPYNVHAWLWLTETRGSIAEKVMVVETCLRHNPDADIAAKALVQLKAQAKNGQNFTAQPAQPIRPAAQSAQPIRPTAQPVARPAQPIAQAAQPAQPTAQPAKPAAKPAKPTTKPAKPAAKPAVQSKSDPNDTYKGEHFMVEAYADHHRFYFPVKTEAGMVVFGALATIFVCLFGPLIAINVQDALAMLCLGVVVVMLGGGAAAELLWQLAGEDVLEVSDRGVRVKHSLAGLGPSRRYKPEAVRRFALVAPPKSQNRNWIIAALLMVVSLFLGRIFVAVPRFSSRFFTFRRGRLAVVFAGRNMDEEACLFGTGLSEQEAEQVLGLLDDLYPHLGRR
jgi:hypothetical protein